jgi:FkbM family methyltransferase
MRKLIKDLYELILFKKYLFLLLRKFKPSPSIYQHLHFKDWINVNIGKSFFKIYHYGYQIENDLFWSGINGNWEKQSLSLWAELCKHSEVILDIGANTGVYSLVAGSVNSKAKVFAFEPSREVSIKLCKNVGANPFNIQVLKKALSNKKGTASFYDKSDHNYTGSLNENSGSNTIAYEVETETLDNFIEEYGLTVDLIKIDVEKHEPEVLEGFKKYISVQQPTILIEILEEEMARKIQPILKDIPYLYFNLNEDGHIKKVSTLTKSDDYNFLICREEIAKNIGLA